MRSLPLFRCRWIHIHSLSEGTRLRIAGESNKYLYNSSESCGVHSNAVPDAEGARKQEPRLQTCRMCGKSAVAVTALESGVRPHLSSCVFSVRCTWGYGYGWYGSACEEHKGLRYRCPSPPPFSTHTCRRCFFLPLPLNLTLTPSERAWR